MSRKARERDRIRCEIETIRNNGQSFLVIKSLTPKNNMATSKKSTRGTRPEPVKRANPDETFDLHPQQSAPVASFVPQMEATAIACVDSVLDAVERGNDGDGFGSVVSGFEAAAYGFGLTSAFLNIIHTRKASRRRAK